MNEWLLLLLIILLLLLLNREVPTLFLITWDDYKNKYRKVWVEIEGKKYISDDIDYDKNKLVFYKNYHMNGCFVKSGWLSENGDDIELRGEPGSTDIWFDGHGHLASLDLLLTYAPYPAYSWSIVELPFPTAHFYIRQYAQLPGKGRYKFVQMAHTPYLNISFKMKLNGYNQSEDNYDSNGRIPSIFVSAILSRIISVTEGINSSLYDYDRNVIDYHQIRLCQYYNYYQNTDKEKEFSNLSFNDVNVTDGRYITLQLPVDEIEWDPIRDPTEYTQIDLNDFEV